MGTDTDAFIECMDLVEEYMRIREDMDSSIRQGFLELAKAKNSEQMRLLGAFQSAPKRVQATRKITVRDYSPENQHPETEEKLDSCSSAVASDDVKDFIQELAVKFECQFAIDENSNNPQRDGNCPDIPYSLWECQRCFSSAIDRVEDIVQVLYKLNRSMKESL